PVLSHLSRLPRNRTCWINVGHRQCMSELPRTRSEHEQIITLAVTPCAIVLVLGEAYLGGGRLAALHLVEVVSTLNVPSLVKVSHMLRLRHSLPSGFLLEQLESA